MASHGGTKGRNKKFDGGKFKSQNRKGHTRNARAQGDQKRGKGRRTRRK